LLDAQDHSLAVDRWQGEPHGFRDAEAGGIAGRQDRAMLGGRDAVEKLDDFCCERAWPIPGGRTGAYVRIGD